MNPSSDGGTLKRRKSADSVHEVKRPKISSIAVAEPMTDTVQQVQRPEDSARNKRFFGALMGHLNRAVKDNSSEKQIEIRKKREEAAAKIMERESEERDQRMVKEREELESELKELGLKIAEQKKIIDIAFLNDQKDAFLKSKCIRTSNSALRIWWKPKRMFKGFEEKLEDEEKQILLEFDEKLKKLEELHDVQGDADELQKLNEEEEDQNANKDDLSNSEDESVEKSADSIEKEARFEVAEDEKSEQ
jgi:hypothetical protein